MNIFEKKKKYYLSLIISIKKLKINFWAIWYKYFLGVEESNRYLIYK